MVDSEKINEVVLEIVSRFKPFKVILFGSYAKGKPDHDSDLDLLVIQDSDLPMHERGMDIRLSLIGYMLPMDIIVYTKSEFEKASKDNYSFLKSALNNSIILYERTDL